MKAQPMDTSRCSKRRSFYGQIKLRNNCAHYTPPVFHNTSVNYKSWGKGNSWTLFSLSFEWTCFPEGIPLSWNDLAFAGHEWCNNVWEMSSQISFPHLDLPRVVSSHRQLPKDGCKGQACPVASLSGGLSPTLLQRLRSLGHLLACFQHPRKSSNTNP